VAFGRRGWPERARERRRRDAASVAGPLRGEQGGMGVHRRGPLSGLENDRRGDSRSSCYPLGSRGFPCVSGANGATVIQGGHGKDRKSCSRSSPLLGRGRRPSLSASTVMGEGAAKRRPGIDYSRGMKKPRSRSSVSPLLGRGRRPSLSGFLLNARVEVVVDEQLLSPYSPVLSITS
jgi:hypothetical protein